MSIPKPKSVPTKAEVNRIKAIMAVPVNPLTTQMHYMRRQSNRDTSVLATEPIRMPGTSKQYAGVI
jgi:hypothetical protein